MTLVEKKPDKMPGIENDLSLIFFSRPRELGFHTYFCDNGICIYAKSCLSRYNRLLKLLQKRKDILNILRQEKFRRENISKNFVIKSKIIKKKIFLFLLDFSRLVKKNC